MKIISSKVTDDGTGLELFIEYQKMVTFRDTAIIPLTTVQNDQSLQAALDALRHKCEDPPTVAAPVQTRVAALVGRVVSS